VLTSAVLERLAIGLVLSITVSWVAHRKQSLSTSGVVGAVLTGTTIFGLGGFAWGGLLIAFFVLSSLLSKFRESRKQEIAEKFAKGSRRDLGQVLANAGVGALIAIASAATRAPLLYFAFTGAIAAVNADTWATEVGVLARRPPRLITSRRTVQAGTSGGITILGTLAALAGSATIGIVAALFLALNEQPLDPRAAAVLVAASALGGMSGAMFDSLLGATKQAIYYAHGRQKETERPIDPDGSPNEHIRGWRWLSNDWVNFLSSLVGAAAAALLWRFT